VNPSDQFRIDFRIQNLFELGPEGLNFSHSAILKNFSKKVYESFLEPGGFKGKKGRGASGKTIVFGLLKRNGIVHKKIAPN
jgi:hypothetical protein